MYSACLNDSDEQLVIFRNSDGKVLKSMDLVQRNFHIVSFELLMGPDDYLEEQGNTLFDVCASDNSSHNSLASQHLERVVPVCSTHT